MSLEETEMEVKNAPAAPEMVGEVIEVTTKVIKKEESLGEAVVTTVTTTVNSFDEKTNTEEKEPEDTDKILEEQNEELEKEIMEMEGGEEEEEGRAKKLTGPWELEVRTLYVQQEGR